MKDGYNFRRLNCNREFPVVGAEKAHLSILSKDLGKQNWKWILEISENL